MREGRKKFKRKALLITLAIILLIIGGMAYSLIRIHQVSRAQEKSYSDLSQQVQELSTSTDNRLTSIEQEYDSRIQRMGDFVIDRYNEYEDQTDKLVEMVEKTEKENDVRLNKLKQELNNLGKADLSNVAANAIKATITVDSNVSRGSGAILTEDGYVVTNNHVVRNLDSTKIIDSDKKKYKAKIVLTDEVRDLAILKVNERFENHLEMTDSSQVLVGERVLAIGNPQGLEFTVTQGIVSANDRMFNEEEGSFIQTDVPINSGSSGGPLINSEGKLVGINTFKIKGSESLGFSIPAEDVKNLLDQARQ